MPAQRLHLLLTALAVSLIAGPAMADGPLRIGWASVDITPDTPVPMRAGVTSTGALDPLTATVLALESGTGEAAAKVVLISCDLQHITDGNRYSANMLDTVRALLQATTPKIHPEQVIMMATHTHVAPSVQADPAYHLLASQRIARAVEQAWQSRQPGGISYGLGHAVIGHNRIATYTDGSSHMVGALQKGSTASADFSHIEGFEDHSVHLLYTWDLEKNLTGIVINTACPAQVLRGDKLSADYWHDTREALRQTLGPSVHLLPQLSAAGDQATIVMVEGKAEKRMQQLMFPAAGNDNDRRRKQIAARLASAVTTVLPLMPDTIDWSPVLAHQRLKLNLPRGFPTPDPAAPDYPVEIHAVRMGGIAMVTNPFELYLDYGVRIKGRSPAIQTFVVQLAGSGSYLPTARAVAAGGYGAIPDTCVVGPQAGDQLVKATLKLLHHLWNP